MLVSNLEVSGSILMHGGGITGSLTGSVIGQFTGSYTGSFRGQFSGSGAQLFDISASAIVGLNLSRISSGSVTASISEQTGFVVESETSGSNFIGTVRVVSGSFSGSGANLFDISASSILGLNLSRIASGSATASIVYSPQGSSSFTVTAKQFTIAGPIFAGYVSPSQTTGSNIFGTASWATNVVGGRFINTGSTNAVQAITGSLIITQNLTVQGSSSFTYVTASQILIDQNTLTVFTSGSSLPNGGYKVSDTSSWDGTGSFLNESSLLYNTVDKYWTLENSLIVSGTLQVSQSVTASNGFLGNLTGTASYATYATHSAYAEEAAGGYPRKFNLGARDHTIKANYVAKLDRVYNEGTYSIEPGDTSINLGGVVITNAAEVNVYQFYNSGHVINNGIFNTYAI